MSAHRPRSAVILTPKANGADGVSAVTRLAARSLVDAGVDTRVLALEDDPRDDLGDGPLAAPVESAGGRRLRFLLNGLKAAGAGQPEIVIATHLRMLPAAVPLAARGVPVATFLLGVECWSALSRRDQSLLSRTRRLLPISRWTHARFLAANPSFATMPMTLCPPGVLTTPAPSTPPVQGRALVVGRLWAEERYKGHDLLIDVWPAVRRACPSAELLVVGDGDDRPRLEARVRDEGLLQAISFAGLVSQEQLRQHFADAQVFVLPSEGEGFGIVFLEAMRAARPCVAAAGAAEEIVVDGVTGVVLAARDRDALTSALVQLLSDSARCDALGLAGRQRLELEFSESRFADRLMAGVDEACAPC